MTDMTDARDTRLTDAQDKRDMTDAGADSACQRQASVERRFGGAAFVLSIRHGGNGGCRGTLLQQMASHLVQQMTVNLAVEAAVEMAVNLAACLQMAVDLA